MARFGARVDEVAATGQLDGSDQRAAGRTVDVRVDLVSARRVMILGLVLLSIWLVARWMFSVVGHFLFLLLLAWLLAVAMEPSIRWMMRHGRGRGTSTAITGVAGIITALAVIALFGNAFVQQVLQFVELAPSLVSDAVGWINATFHTTLDANKISDQLQLTPGNIAQVAESLAGGVVGFLGSAMSVLFDLFTVVVFAFYFASSGPRLFQSLAVWLPPRQQRVAATVWEITATKTGGYVVSKAELAALSAIFHGIFFWAIGLPSWLPMALLVGITAQFVPMVGTYIGVAVPVIIALFEDPLDAVWIIAFSSVYQQIETYVFTPRVSRRTMDVNPVIALSAVFIGAAIWGPLGAIIGIPIAAAAVALAETYGRRYELAADAVVDPVAPDAAPAAAGAAAGDEGGQPAQP